jgi:alpha-galactosidase
MQIQYDASLKTFHLQADNMSYAFGIAPDGRIRHLYWGRALGGFQSLAPLAGEALKAFEPSAGVDKTPAGSCAELPCREPGDYGDPVLWLRHSDGTRGLRPIYESHRIEGDHLTLIVRDAHYPVRVEMHYRGWADLPLISRWLVVENLGEAPVEMQAVKSAAWHLPAGWDYRLTHLSGNWGCEYTKNQLMLTQARTVLQNSRVTSAASQQTAFFALDKDGASTETMGPVYFGVLHWSGDFNITVERQFGRCVSVTGGVNEFDARYMLEPGERFETPQFTAGYSDRGFERMSEVFYDWQFDHLMPRGKKTDKAHAVRPVIYNSWYPYEFDVCEENCLALIDKCADLGVELFVIDDGWMPKRTSSKAGLGDWTADEERFPRGLEAISKACHDKGMMFGLWVEPEMVNPDSDLYRAHPDWVIHDPARPKTLQRNQLVLNLARDDVRDWAIEWLDDLIDRCKLDYLKWDMNRYVTEGGWPDAPYDQQQSLSIRYGRNLLAIWKHLNEKHPDVLFENCAHGGGRSDFGMVPYADRINRSDNADPVDVMVLHEGFSMLFVPKTAGGAGNIAPAAHHIHNRPTPLNFRIHWGMTGSMSIGINLLTAPEEELEALRQGVCEFKRLRPDLQDAYVYRIASATRNPYALFQYVRRDRKAFTLFAFAHGMRCWDLATPRFAMRGLIADALYEDEHGNSMTGDALMNIGLPVHLKGDCDSLMSVWRIRAEASR